MANINAAAPALKIENAPGGVLVDGVLYPAMGTSTLVWEGPSRSGRFHFLLAHSVTEGLFTVTVGTCQDPYRFLAHPMLTKGSEPRGYPLDTAVSLLRTFQARW